jgi:hypothetical protein
MGVLQRLVWTFMNLELQNRTQGKLSFSMKFLPASIYTLSAAQGKHFLAAQSRVQPFWHSGN